jgi:nitroreductase
MPMTVEDAIAGRHSVRAYLDKPVPREVLETVLRIAGRAPSGTNVQPWNVWVLSPARKAALTTELMALHDAGAAPDREYPYYPEKWREPYLARRRACGFGLYATLGIPRGDQARMHAQHAQNWHFFGAPSALMFSVDSDLEKGSWLDCGMFIQSVMIAARGEGLATCPQAAFAYQAPTVKRIVGIPATQTLICGMAIGYEDTTAVVNSFITVREPLETFVTWVD